MATTIGLGLDGLIVAPIEGGRVWDALMELRRVMRSGHACRATFVTAMARDGGLVAAEDPNAAVLVLGFRAR